MKKVLVLFFILSSLLNAGCFSQTKTYKDTRFSMDTTISIEAVGKNNEQIKTAVDNAFNVFQEIADETDRYKDSSPQGLYQLNAHAGQGPFTVGHHLLLLTDMAHKQNFSEFDITLAPLIDVWQKHSADKTLPDKQELDAALTLTGKDKFNVAAGKQTITLAPGAGLDLGAIAKGYAVDRAHQAAVIVTLHCGQLQGDFLPNFLPEFLAEFLASAGPIIHGAAPPPEKSRLP